MCRSLVRDPGSDEVGIADGLDLVHSILIDQEVKERVEAVQEYPDLDSDLLSVPQRSAPSVWNF